METIIRDKWDLFTMITKINPNTGVNWIYNLEIQMEDGTWEEVTDYYCDYATSEIHLEFKSGTDGSFNLREKFVVRVDKDYKRVHSKKKRRKK